MNRGFITTALAIIGGIAVILWLFTGDCDGGNTVRREPAGTVQLQRR